MRLFQIPIGLGVSILLARFLGPEQFGQYTFVMVLVPLLALPITGGMQNLLTREVAAYSHAGKWPLYKGVLRAAHGWVLLVSGTLLLLYYLLAFVLDVIPTSGKWSLLSISIIMLPMLGLNAVRSGVIKGLGRPAMAELPGLLIQPTIGLLSLAAIAYTMGLNAERAIWVQVGSAASSLLIASLIFAKIRPQESNRQRPEYELKSWAAAFTPFVLLALIGTFSAQLGILALGLFSSDDQVAALRVAERGAQFVTMSLVVVNLIISPHIVKAYRSNDMELLQKLSKQSARGAFAIALPIGLVFIFFGDWLLGILFGEEYSNLSYIPLVILVVGQLINVFFGSVGFMLAMTGHEKLSFKGTVLALAINLVLCSVLIPFYGAIGAAIAVSVSVVIWNITFGYMVFTKLGIRPSAL